MREVELQRLIGRTIAAKFVVEQLLGTGAMGAVFRARQIALDKTVAIKVLHGEHAQDATFAARFQREARAASRLNHPNSMQVVDFGVEPDGLLYIAMEYLDGRTLHRVLRDEWPLPAQRIADILMQALAAIAVAHDMGVVHRDLKPENVMVLRGTDDDGRPTDLVKVCDFGIAKITDSRAYQSGERQSIAPVTTAGFLVGTPEYMSPEQGRGEKLGPTSDLYSVGVILYEMLTRRVPFTAENAIGVVLKHIAEVPTRPSILALAVDRRLEAICLRALNKVPEDRYRSARDMRAELRAIAQERPTSSVALAATVAQVPGEGGVAAPTISMKPTAPASGVTEDVLPKTLLGTTSTVPASTSRRAILIASAALASGVILTAGTIVATRMHTRSAVAPAHASAADAALPTSVTPLEMGAPLAELTPTDLSATAAASRTTPRGRPAQAATNVKTVVETGATVPPGAPLQASRPIASGGATGPVLGVGGTSVSAFPPDAPRPLAPPAQAPDPSFDPDRGYVEVGLINAQGARESAVRAALRGIGLVRCYRNALRTSGTRATGTATLDVSFDESGLARSAIVTGTDFLPSMARCVQEVSAGIRIPRGSVGAGGGTAEVILAFKMGG
jgi:serine/threonine-protein kinase